MAWYELFSFQELSRVMKNLFFENILWAKGFLFLNEKPFSLLSNLLYPECLNDVLDYTVTECFSTFSSCILFYIFLSSILLLRPVENTQYLETQWKFPEGEEKSRLKSPKEHQKSGKAVNESFSVCLVSFASSNTTQSLGGPSALCFWEALSKVHLWISVPPLWELLTLDSSLNGLRFSPLLCKLHHNHRLRGYCTRVVAVCTCIWHTGSGQ